MPVTKFPGLVKAVVAPKKTPMKTVFVPKTVGLGLPAPTRTKKMWVERTRTINLQPVQYFAKK